MPDQPIVEVVIRVPGTMLKDVVFQCPDLTWHEIFLTIDRLRQGGILTLTPNGDGRYAVNLSDRPFLATSSRAVA